MPEPPLLERASQVAENTPLPSVFDEGAKAADAAARDAARVEVQSEEGAAAVPAVSPAEVRPARCQIEGSQS